MVEWDGKKTLDYWSGEQCNRITGRDPSGLPLLIQKSDVLSLFIGQLCRPLNFKYLKDTVVDGEFATMRFIPEENSFSSPDRVPENQCYCLTPGSCMPSGILDISGCQPGSPVYMSWPHFLHGDPKLFETVNGLSPDEDIHSFTMDLMPVSVKSNYESCQIFERIDFRNTASPCRHLLDCNSMSEWIRTPDSVGSTTLLKTKFTFPFFGLKRESMGLLM